MQSEILGDVIFIKIILNLSAFDIIIQSVDGTEMTFFM